MKRKGWLEGGGGGGRFGPGAKMNSQNMPSQPINSRLKTAIAITPAKTVVPSATAAPSSYPFDPLSNPQRILVF